MGSLLRMPPGFSIATLNRTTSSFLVTKSGYAKLADFGLAKLAGNIPADVALLLSEERTGSGIIVGTIAYMSPEQASGKPVDARSDVFSFGVLLHELLSGRRPFTGETGMNWLPDNRHIIAGVADHTADYTSTLVLVDTEDGSVQRVYSSVETIFNVAVSPNGRRLAYTRGLLEWNVLEIALSGSVRTVLGGNGITSWWPDWARSGTHFLVTTNRSGGQMVIEDVSSTESFSRRLYSSEIKEYEVAYNARWSPDGSRFAFTTLLPTVLFLASFAVSAALSQSISGTISGFVKDPQNARLWGLPSLRVTSKRER
jgi:serine/threonine protein kinase